MHPLEQLAREWADKVESYRLTHYAFGDRFRLANNIVGSTGVVLSTIVSAGLLTAIHSNPSYTWTLVAAVIGVLAAALNGIRHALRLGARAEQHRVTAARFGGIRDQLDVYVDSEPDWMKPDAKTFMDGIGAEISRIEESAPGYSKGAYEKAQKRALEARAHRPKP
jgi:conflict system pore-forming effector with SLATT domain